MHQGKRTRLLHALSVAALLLSVSVGAASEPDRLVLTGEHERQQFAAAAQVRVRDARLVDAFVAGGEVEFERVTAEDLFVAAGSLRYRDSVFTDLVTAGGEVMLDANIEDDLIGAAGRFRIDPGASIGGDVILAGGDLEIAGRIDGNVNAAGARVVIAGAIGGDVSLAAGELIVEPTARIAGRLVYTGDDEARISDEAIIVGGVVRTESRTPRFSVWTGVGIGIAVLAALLLGLMLMGVALQTALPGPCHEALVALRARPWAAWLIGFAGLVAVPVAANLLLVTVVGIPLGTVVYGVYLVGLAFGVVSAAYWIGSWFARVDASQSAIPGLATRAGRTCAGMLVLVLFGLVPFLGWAFLLAAVPLGAGAFAATAWRGMRGNGQPATAP